MDLRDARKDGYAVDREMNNAPPDDDGFHHIDAHRVRFEPPDILLVQTNGTIHPDQCDVFFNLVYGLCPDRPFYILRDAQNGGVHGSETRSRILELSDPARFAGIAIFGASFRLRVLVTMLHKTVRTLKRSFPDATFVDTEAEARAWIQAHRQRAISAQKTKD